jgi:RND family efflux transporter MFP subunit
MRRTLPALLSAAAVTGALALPAAARADSGAPAVVSARLQAVEEVYAAEAVIEAVRQATVAAQLPGAVVQILVDAGDPVKRGQVVARIDTRETDAQLAAGQAGVAQADAALAQARLNLERTRSLLAQNFVSRAALDKAEADHAAARAAADAARAGRAQAATARSYAELRSPIDGVVTRRLMEPGEVAAPGRGVLAVHDPSALRAVGSVPQGVLAQAAGATRATVEAGGQRIDAVRVTLLPAADARLLSAQVRADLPAGAHAGVVPGSAAKILLPVGRATRLVVPASALIRRGELTAVQVVGADGKPQLRQVRLGPAVAGGNVEVLAGLAEGERVFVNPLARAP